jgi:hypothetical protein
MFGSGKKDVIDKVNKYNINPKSEVRHIYVAERKKISTEIFKGGISVLGQVLSQEFVIMAVLEDSIIFIDKDDKKFSERMFWSDTSKYSFEIKVDKKYFGAEIIIKFTIAGKLIKTVFWKDKSKDSDERISEKTLSFLLSQIDNRNLMINTESYDEGSGSRDIIDEELGTPIEEKPAEQNFRTTKSKPNFCRDCGTSLDTAKNFCPNCGNKL